jgi:hypothetical protein
MEECGLQWKLEEQWRADCQFNTFAKVEEDETWLVPLFAALIAITYVPEITLWLPRILAG